MAPIAVSLSYYRPWAATAIAAALYYQIIVNQDYSVRNAPFYMAKYLLCFLAVWAAYTVFLYPAFFSPLRHLPQPKVRGMDASLLEISANEYRVPVLLMVTGRSRFVSLLVCRLGDG
jgi:hypothetical protein